MFKKSTRYLSTLWQALTGDWQILLEQPTPSGDLTQTLEQSSIPSFGYYFLLVLATTIATFGLMADSSATIIGAMIIAPLMNPIVGLAYGITTANRRLVRNASLTLITGIILVILVAYLSTELIGLRVVSSEILSRVKPTLLDLGIALAAGAAAGFAYTRGSIANALPGVAISVALVPPLSVTGIALAFGSKASTLFGSSLEARTLAVGSFVLFITNLAGILFSGSLVFLVQAYGHIKRSIGSLSFTFGVLLLLFFPLSLSLHELSIRSTALQSLLLLKERQPDLFPGVATIESINVERQNNKFFLDVIVKVPVNQLSDTYPSDFQDRVSLWQNVLSEKLGEPVQIRANIVPIHKIQVEVPQQN